MLKRNISLIQIGTIIGILCVPVFAKKAYNLKKGKHKMTQSVIINEKRYANWQNSSFLPVIGTLKGDELWNTPILKQYIGDSPYHLCMGDNCLIAVYIKWVDVKQQSTGYRIWTREFYNLSDFTLDTEGIWVVSPNDSFYKISVQNNKTEEVNIVFFSDYPKLLFIQPDKDNYFYIYNRFPSSFDKPVLDEGFIITTFNATERKIHFEYNENTIALCSVLSNDKKECFLAAAYHLYSFPIPASSEKDINKINFPFIKSLSVYTDGNLIAAQDIDQYKKIPEPKNKRIVSLTPKGKINWEVPINELSKSGQPPAFAPGGNIYYCAGNTLISIKEGDVEWEYEITGGNTEIYLTVLQDQSVLVAALNMLHHISQDGELITSVINPFVLTCRPIMDTDGKVYIGGKEGIRCLE